MALYGGSESLVTDFDTDKSCYEVEVEKLIMRVDGAEAISAALKSVVKLSPWMRNNKKGSRGREVVRRSIII